MRIGIVADKLNVTQGGSNFSLELIARSLVERGHDVVVVTVHFAHENDLPEDYDFEVRSMPLDTDSNLDKARTVANLFSELAPEFDVFHLFNPALLPSAGWYRRTDSATPVVGRLNTYDVFCTNLSLMDGECHRNCTTARKFAHSDRSTTSRVKHLPKYAFDTHAFPRLASNLDRLFAVSPAVGDIYEGIGVDRETIRVMPNFYDPSFGTESDATRSFDYERTALYVGALKEYKGSQLLVDAVAELPEHCGVVLVGDGPERESIQRHARRRDVRDRISICGRVDHEKLPAYYRGADAFVHPGLWPEPLNRTVLEAMQCGCPPLVSDVGGPPWVVDDDRLVFERGDVSGLVTQLEALLSDQSRRADLRSKCSRRLEDFAPERSVSRLETQYREVVTSSADR